MKKILIFLIFVVAILSILLINYNSYALQKSKISAENEKFEVYLNKDIFGIDIASVINKAIDKNTKNGIKKDENNLFIQNNENSIEVEVYLKEGEQIYKMEQIYKQGTEQFVQFFIDAKFKTSKVEYHEKTGLIKYILFEQI